MSKIRISIIVPVYNEEKFLSKCLDSLLNLNYSKKSFEIIAVNDGSTDLSPTILKKYSDKNPNLVVLSKANGGKGSAQNLGIKKIPVS